MPALAICFLCMPRDAVFLVVLLPNRLYIRNMLLECVLETDFMQCPAKIC